MKESSKIDKWKNIAIIVLLLLVVVLLVILFGVKNKKSDQKTEEMGTVVEVDVKKANDSLKILGTALHFSLDGANKDWYVPSKVVYKKELLDRLAVKNDFVWAAVVLTDKEDLFTTQERNGVRVTGEYSVHLNIYKNYYYNIFGDDIHDEKSYESIATKFEVTPFDYIHGSFWEEYDDKGTILKFNKLTEKDGQYTLLIDVLAYDENNLEKVQEYSSSDKNDYPENLVSYRLQLKLTKATSEIYTIKSIQIIEK